jgi:hypothetical protein
VIELVDNARTGAAQVVRTMVAHYAAFRPVSRPRVALWEALNILELVIRSWDRVKPIRLNQTIVMLERQLRAQFTASGLHS